LPLLVGLALVATASVGTSSAALAQADVSGTTRILLVDQPAVQDLVDNWIPKFEEATECDVTVEVIPEAGLDEKMALSAGAGQFDVFMVGVRNWSPAITAGWLEPVDRYLGDEEASPADWLDGFPPELLANLQVDGVSYAIPYIASANLLFYNKEMFEEAGLDPNDPPANLEEVLQAAEALHKPDQGQVAYVGRASRDQNSFAWLMFWLLNGGRWPTPGPDARFDLLLEPESVNATTQITDLYTKYGPTGIATYTFADAQLAMQQGLAAMWYDAAQLGPALDDPEQSLIAGKVGYAPLEGIGDAYVTGAVWAWGMAADTPNGDCSWELIKFLTSEELAVGQAIAGTNPSPGRASVLGDPAVQEALGPEFLDALAAAIPQANPAYTPLIPEGGEIRDAIALAISEIIDGADVTEALTKANEEIVRITEG
jgi:ABC-type glycerol-3-phosphate transport system substrate-binding protein